MSLVAEQGWQAYNVMRTHDVLRSESTYSEAVCTALVQVGLRAYRLNGVENYSSPVALKFARDKHNSTVHNGVRCI